MFTPMHGATAPYTLRIFSPTGANIVDTIVRDLPTTEPQSAPAFEFVVSVGGRYRIEIREMRGRQRGEGTLSVASD
jgi:hypothetical protein